MSFIPLTIVACIIQIHILPCASAISFRSFMGWENNYTVKIHSPRNLLMIVSSGGLWPYIHMYHSSRQHHMSVHTLKPKTRLLPTSFFNVSFKVWTNLIDESGAHYIIHLRLFIYISVKTTAITSWYICILNFTKNN